MGFVLTDDDVLMLPIPLPCHVLEDAVRELGLSSPGPLRPGLRSRAPACGFSFPGAAGPVWAIHKGDGDGMPDQANCGDLLLCHGRPLQVCGRCPRITL